MAYLSQTDQQTTLPRHALTVTERQQHQRKLDRRLKSLGAVTYNMWLPETKALPDIIHLDENLVAIIYGRYTQKGRFGGHETNTELMGRGVIAVTDQRVLFIDKKPLFLKYDEIAKSIISGVTYSHVVFGGTVTLHTRAGDYHMRTFNDKLARGFVEAIEKICFEKRLFAVDDDVF